MKFKSIVLLLTAFAFVLLSSFSNESVRFEHQQQPKIQDSIKKSEVVKDSLKMVSGLKLKLNKKNAHASYYADKLNGRRTASGRKFDNAKYTAAHRKFPFGTKLKITNEANGKSVIVEVTDRGPFTKGRDIDLTKRAFMEIAGSKYGGSLKVMIEEIRI